MAHVHPQSTAQAPPSMPTVHGKPLPAPVYANLLAGGLTHETIVDVCTAVEDGVGDLKGFFGITPSVLDAIEAAALAFYRQGLFMYAALQYTFVVDVDGERASGWRGLGATLLALGQIDRALVALTTASLYAPEDVVARFILGEALVAAHQGPAAKRTLEGAIRAAGDSRELATYVRRARGILAARDLTTLAPPPTPAAEAEGATSSPAAQAQPGFGPETPPSASMPPAGRLPTPDEAAQMTLHDLMQHPDSRALFDKLWRGLQQNAITLKDVGGMTDEQMVGAYNAGCRLLEARQPIPALRIAGWLQYYDGRNPLYYRLGGVAAQQMELWCLADYLFALALIWGPGDPITEIYRGEVKIFSDEQEAGLALIRQALPKLGKEPFEQALAARGRAVLKFHQVQKATP